MEDITAESMEFSGVVYKNVFIKKITSNLNGTEIIMEDITAESMEVSGVVYKNIFIEKIFK